MKALFITLRVLLGIFAAVGCVIAAVSIWDETLTTPTRVMATIWLFVGVVLSIRHAVKGD